MKKLLVALLIIFILLPSEPIFAVGEFKLLASIPDYQIALFAVESPEKRIYEHFLLKRGKYTINFPDWTNVTNPQYPPRIFYQDVTDDNIKEIIVFLTEAYGPGMLKSSVHVIQKFKEMSLDRPVPFIEKSRASLGLKPDVSIGGIVYYEMEKNRLIVYANAGPDELIKGIYRFQNGNLKLEKVSLVKK